MSLEAANDNKNSSHIYEYARLATSMGLFSLVLAGLIAGSYTIFPDSNFRESDLETLGTAMLVSGGVTLGALIVAMFTQPANIEKC